MPSFVFFAQSYLFFRGKGGVQQAKQDAAVAAFQAQVAGGQPADGARV